MKKIILSVALLAVLFTGCKKKEDDPAPATPATPTPVTPVTPVTPTPTPKTKTELLTANTWIISGSTSDKAIDYDLDGKASLDIYGQMDECEKDDSFNFLNVNNTKSGTINEGPKACQDNAPATIAFTWGWNSTESILTINAPAIDTDIEYTLIELTATTLKASYTVTDEDNVVYTITDTYSKK